MIEDYIDQGLLHPNEAETSSIANVITRAIGAEDELEVDYKIDTMNSGDVYLLCSDGLYREVTEQQISEGMAINNSATSAKQLLNHALSNQARDNITLGVIHIRKAF